MSRKCIRQVSWADRRRGRFSSRICGASGQIFLVLIIRNFSDAPYHEVKEKQSDSHFEI
ncbi:hypothetical protein AmaxDRAFT_1242 [Limnospira maxima CS-328]|uniref:Uncharacterized protein n=1 Tax=Limnospira maxima CS-328 TaxID=513049 RepID=B5VXK0_LIMMA|nr:hypothetical protein AmaxDRAFT_1242 [Limnospira maxima CS-328]UWU51459.1 hypothetical protein APLC1_6419 [Arthrospira platensis C1]